MSNKKDIDNNYNFIKEATNNKQYTVIMKTVLLLVLSISPIFASPQGARIIGGQTAYAGEFPYAAAITIRTAEGQYFCTGSLLFPQWVITAGQCVNGGIVFEVLLGTHKLNGDTSTVEKLATNDYFLHPDFDPLTLVHDIGLIKLRVPVTQTTYIKVINLPYAEYNTAVGITFGWGQLSDTNSSLSDNLNYVTLSSVSDEECRLTYGAQLVENLVCFEGNFNQGTCQGDGGSPIIQHISRGYTIIIAVATFFSSRGCETTDPSGYTKVYPYNGWIREVTGYPE